MEKGRQEKNVLTQSTDAYFVLYFHAQFDELDPERHRLLDLKLDHGFRMQSTRGIYVYIYCILPLPPLWPFGFIYEGKGSLSVCKRVYLGLGIVKCGSLCE